MTAALVGVLDYLTEAELECELLGPGVDLRCFGWRAGEPLPDGVADQEVLCLWHLGRLGTNELARLSRCRAVVRAGVGFDNVEIEAAGRLGIPVVTVPDYGVDDVADHAWALLLALMRRLDVYGEALKSDLSRGWNPDAAGRGMRRLRGLRLGIVGFGRIGSAMARRAEAFGLEVAFFDPYLRTGAEKSWQVQRFEQLEGLLGWADIVSLHAPASSETRGLIDASAFACLRTGAILVNTARGELVDHAALEQALRSGRLTAYAADVWSPEPPSEVDPLIRAHRIGEDWLRGRLLLTPHCAFRSDECTRELRTKVARQVSRVLANEPLPDCVNLEFLHSPRAAVLRRNPPR